MERFVSQNSFALVLLVFALVSGIFIAAQSKHKPLPVTNETVQQIYGRVVGRDTEAVVRDARVRLEANCSERVTFTDTSGEFEFDLSADTKISDLVLYVEKEKYVPFAQKLVGSDQSLLSIDVRLVPASGATVAPTFVSSSALCENP